MMVHGLSGQLVHDEDCAGYQQDENQLVVQYKREVDLKHM